MNYALSCFGHEPLQLSACTAYIGPPLEESFTAITGVTSSVEIRALIEKYRERYCDVGFSENTLYPGIAEALQALAQSKIPLAVCTSKRKDFAERILAMFGLREYFMFVSGGDVGIEKWQQIEGMLRTGAISASTVMIGDRSVDISSAHRNGLFSAGVLWGHGSRAELETERPSYLFSSPVELLSLVSG
jgi:phosphoglycolate phosphatase